MAHRVAAAIVAVVLLLSPVTAKRKRTSTFDFIQTVVKEESTGNSDIIAPTITGTTGSLLVVDVYWAVNPAGVTFDHAASTAGVGACSQWSNAGSATDGNGGGIGFYHIARAYCLPANNTATTSLSVSAVFSSAFTGPRGIRVMEFVGQSDVAFDQATGANSTGSTNPSSGTITTTRTHALLVSQTLEDSVRATATSPPWTDAGSGDPHAEYRAVSSTGTYNSGWTSTSQAWIANLATFTIPDSGVVFPSAILQAPIPCCAHLRF